MVWTYRNFLPFETCKSSKKKEIVLPNAAGQRFFLRVYLSFYAQSSPSYYV